jgi:hypothetical protein
MERNRGAIRESGIQCLELSHTLLVSGGIATTHEDFVDGIFSQRPYTSILRNLYDTSISSQMLVQRFVAEIKCGDRTYTIDSVHYSRGANKLPTFRLWRKARSPKPSNVGNVPSVRPPALQSLPRVPIFLFALVA